MTERQLLIVFDIDETLIQYIPNKYYSEWKKRKSLFPEGSYVESTQNGNTSVVIFRPELEKMIQLFQNDSFFVPALWTYSERDYADFIANVIITRFNLPSDFFLFKKGAEDIDEDVGIPKDLTVVYREYPQFNKFNTILVDDRYGNINNESNMYNGICIQPFAPFGAEKVRISMNKRQTMKELNDKVFESIIHIANSIKKDIMGCDESDFQEAFSTEPIFSEKRIHRMKLNQYYQTFAVKFRNVISIGKPYETTKFILIPGYGKYSKKMGGSKKRNEKRKTHRKNR